MQDLKIGYEFKHEGKVYKATYVTPENRFWAIYIGQEGDLDNYDYTTYRAYMDEGHFLLDNAEFDLSPEGEVRMVKDAPGMIGLLKEIAEGK